MSGSGWSNISQILKPDYWLVNSMSIFPFLSYDELAVLVGHTSISLRKSATSIAGPLAKYLSSFAALLNIISCWVFPQNEFPQPGSLRPDGKLIVTASADDTAQLRPSYLSLESKLAVARQRLLKRSFTDEECRRFFRDDPDTCPQTVEALFALFDDAES